MTIPKHFSLEVSQRALKLIREFYDRTSDIKSKSLPKATLLLSMSMPIVILPLERIKKYGNDPSKGHMNDTTLNKDLANAIEETVNFNEKVHKKEFFADLWQYASFKKGKGFSNLAVEGLPKKIVEELNSQEEATKRAGQLSTLCFFKILRNALAHGGILYSDEHGRSRPDSIVDRFVFVSTGRSDNLTEFRFLQIKVTDYRIFLEEWIEWMMGNQAINKVMADDLGSDTIDEQ